MAGSNFEMQLAQLADAEIAQNAPSLVPYKIGFQLIDKDEDDTRGVGVLVFKIDNKQWIYIPTFYLNGRIRGMDLMFLPQTKQFMPAKENWVSYIKGKFGQNLGSPSKNDKKDREGTPGNVDIDSDSTPFSKTAALLIDGSLEEMSKKVDYNQNMFDLRMWVPFLGKEAAARLLKDLNSDVDYANAFLKFYNVNDLQWMVKSAMAKGAMVKNETSEGSTELKIITPDMPDAKKLSNSEKEALIKDQVFVVDNRSDTSTVFKGDIDHKALSTPTSDGVYDILMSDGSYGKFYVMKSRGSTEKGLYLIPFDNKEIFLTDRPYGKEISNIQGKKLLDHKFKYSDFGKAVSGLRDTDKYINVILMDADGNNFPVSFNKGPRVMVGNRMKVSLLNSNWACKFLEFTGQDSGKLFMASDTIYVPKGSRYVTEATYEQKSKYSFGNPNTTLRELTSKINLKPMKVYSDGARITISTDEATSSPLEKTSALIYLIKDHGIGAPEAKLMVKSAMCTSQPKADRYLIKYANDFTYDMGTNPGATVAPDEDEETDVGGEELGDEKQKAIAASESGIKDVMDVSVLKRLANSVKPLDAVDDAIPTIMNGMDAAGRLLFLFYWHNEEFADRYGQEDIKELEERLQDMFDITSDVALYLSKKTVKPNSVMEALSGDLAENIGV